MVFLPIAERLARAALRARGIRGRMIDTPVGRVNVYEGRGAGTLPPVVVVHGIGSAGAPFGPVLARLLPHVRSVVAPELPGHGFSAPPHRALTPDTLLDVMRDVLDRVIDEPVILCGNSLGGAIVLRYARDRPEKVRGLVLLSPAGARMSDEELEDVRRAFHMPTTADARAFVARVYHRTPPLTSLFASGIRARMQSAVVQGLLADASPDHAATPDDLAALAMPVTLVWGCSERLLPASGLAYFREHLPRHARIEEPDAVGHCPHFDDPALVARLVLDMARQVSATPRA
ncbi:alpha/beta fold hydrolase [Sandaracinus amylolyticus]|uniref:Putative hydrolase n=1 Tax=Sandaracinus amylolyticus TaxID=927083 RepID=A0A0F6YM20_9BACT|nr:alpha/beta fold hydrolase [Sandaracinus amylolyticus]AKF10185.1 putative hydrolase [Sandaracinus amylolyticus]